MKIIYRPQRGSLADAMKEVKEFTTVKGMFDYIVKQWTNACDRAPFGVDDLSIRYYCYDDRIDWETYLICTDRMFKEKYDYPQAIGFCTFKE